MVQLTVYREIEERHWEKAARVSVELQNGAKPTALVVHFKGTPQNPLGQSELLDKIKSLNRGILSPRKLDRLISDVSQLEKVRNISTLTARLRNRN